MPDDIKQQQQQQYIPTKQISDHAYSISPASPHSGHSDSGISNGPYSPSNSSSSCVEDLGFDLERDLFAPLDLKSYEPDDNHHVVNPSTLMELDLDTISESSSPGLLGNESPISFGKNPVVDS